MQLQKHTIYISPVIRLGPEPHHAIYIGPTKQKQRKNHTIIIRCLGNKKCENQNDQSNKNKLTHHFSPVIRLGRRNPRKKERQILRNHNHSNVENTANIQMYPLQNNIHVSKVHCGSAFEPSWLPYYCKPPVYVPAVIGALAVWRQITKNRKI